MHNCTCRRLPWTPKSPVRQCGAELPEEWVEYEVRVGDNLSVLAERGGSTVQELMEVNCLKSETILIGATLYVPEDECTGSRTIDSDGIVQQMLSL